MSVDDLKVGQTCVYDDAGFWQNWGGEIIDIGADKIVIRWHNGVEPHYDKDWLQSSINLGYLRVNSLRPNDWDDLLELI